MSDGHGLDYYAEPDPPAFDIPFPIAAGVSKGYVVFRDESGDVQEVLEGTLLSEGNGKFYWQPNGGSPE